MKQIIMIITAVCLLANCKENKETMSIVEVPTEVEDKVKEVLGTPFVQSIERAHQKKIFLSHDAVEYDFSVAFGGNTIFEGTILQKTDGSMIRLEKNDSNVILVDKNNVYAEPVDLQSPMTRFHAYTWSYFFALPYKLNDEGTRWSDDQELTFGDFQYPTSRLTFENGVGDTSQDWYIVYKDPKTNVMDGVAYIVSYGKDIADAEKEPHFAKYNDLTVVDGVPFASSWSFHNWSKEAGYTNQIGLATIKNVKFIDDTKGLFEKSTTAVTIPMIGQ